MSLAKSPKGFQLVGPTTHCVTPCYLVGKDEAGNDVAGYRGDLITMTASGPRILRSDTDTAQDENLLGVLQEYVAAGAAAAWVSIIKITPDMIWAIQSDADQATAAYAFPADIGSGVDLYCSTTNAAPSTTALTSGLRIKGKETTNVVCTLVGLDTRAGNDLTSSASNYPWLYVQFPQAVLFAGVVDGI